MSHAELPRVGYVVKRYPRYSETFIVNEILAHERDGLEVRIFSLRPPNDSHFQEAIARVRAPVRYLYLPDEGLTSEPLTAEALKAADFWTAFGKAGEVLPGLWTAFKAAQGEEARAVYQALLLAREARLQGIGHLHAHFASAATTVARLAACFAGLPYTFTAHAKDIFHESVRPDDLRRKLSDAAAVVTVSDYNRAYLEQTYGPETARVKRIYNGLDLERFPYEAPHDRPRPQGEVIRHVQGAAAFAAPCVVGTDGNRDGLPTVLLEAMALGTPCVSTDVTGIPEVVQHGETGLLVPQHDPAALARALERLLDEPALGVRLADRARRLIEAEFDIHRNVARLREIFAAARPPARFTPSGGDGVGGRRVEALQEVR